MGNKILGSDIAGILNRELGPRFLAATLLKRSAGTRSATASTSGTEATETPYTAKGITSDYTQSQIASGLVRVGDREVLLLGDSIEDGQVPAPNDGVTIEGRTYRIVTVTRDPDAATYACQARGRGS